MALAAAEYKLAVCQPQVVIVSKQYLPVAFYPSAVYESTVQRIQVPDVTTAVPAYKYGMDFSHSVAAQDMVHMTGKPADDKFIPVDDYILLSHMPVPAGQYEFTLIFGFKAFCFLGKPCRFFA
jgi:hypothetical protein